MKNLSLFAAVAMLFVFTSGCMAMTTRAPLTGFLYTDTKAGEEVTSNSGASKTGTACAQSILGLVATGDASVSTAARSAGITKIAYVDGKSTNILGIVATYCTEVYGE